MLSFDQCHGISDGPDFVSFIVLDRDPEDVFTLDNNINEPSRIHLQIVQDVCVHGRSFRLVPIPCKGFQDIEHFQENFLFIHCLNSFFPFFKNQTTIDIAKTEPCFSDDSQFRIVHTNLRNPI